MDRIFMPYWDFRMRLVQGRLAEVDAVEEVAAAAPPPAPPRSQLTPLYSIFFVTLLRCVEELEQHSTADAVLLSLLFGPETVEEAAARRASAWGEADGVYRRIARAAAAAAERAAVRALKEKATHLASWNDDGHFEGKSCELLAARHTALPHASPVASERAACNGFARRRARAARPNLHARLAPHV